MNKLMIVCAVYFLLFQQSVAIAATDDHIVCSLSEKSRRPPTYLDEVFSVYFEKTGASTYHNATVAAGRSTVTFTITERDSGLNRLFIETASGVVLLSFDSIKPVPFVGEYSLPTLSISTEKYYFMCRESDAGWITANFPQAILIK